MSAKARNVIRSTGGDRVFNAVNYTLLTLILLVVLYPLYFVVIASFSDPLAVVSGQVWVLPVRPTLEPYQMVMRNELILSGYANTILYAITGTVLNMIINITAAYALSRKYLAGRGIVMKLLVFTMYFSGGLIPIYLQIYSMGLIDTFWVMILPNAVSITNIIIMRTYFQTSIPGEIEESAHVDGASHLQTLLRIMLPLSKPILAVIALFYVVSHWNAFFNGLIYLTSQKKYPLQLVMRNILLMKNQAEEMLAGVESTHSRVLLAETIKYAVIVISTAPMLIVYPFLQKYFAQGIMIGSVKG